MKDIDIYTESERYDMSPTLDNFACFTVLDRGEQPDLPVDTYDISCCSTSLHPTAKTRSYRMISLTISLITTGSIRSVTNSRKLRRRLKKGRSWPIYGNWLEFCSGSNTRISAGRGGGTRVTAEKPARQLPDVAKRLANRLKKGKGITR